MHALRGLLPTPDVYLLAAWCNAATRYEHNMRLAAKSDVIPVRGTKLSGVDLKDRPVMHNPFSTGARAYLRDMAMLAAELGFTPSARARLGAFESAAGHADDPWADIAG
ncbi:MAG: P27 family phage terminase small subunit [Gammaproteobacteria bacterium]|nr:P27 family phage terminase small subunit [Gammaproteobacteria bacterium]